MKILTNILLIGACGHMGKVTGGDENAYEEEKDYSDHIVKHGTV